MVRLVEAPGRSDPPGRGDDCMTAFRTRACTPQGRDLKTNSLPARAGGFRNTPHHDEPFLKFSSVVYSHGRGRAVGPLSLTVRSGEYVAIVGPNGSGKSTILALAAGLIAPQSGQLEFSRPLTPGKESSGVKPVCLVFQTPEDQIVSSTVEDDVAFGCENLGLDPVETGVRVVEALRLTGLADLRTRPTRFLSAGQQQRLAIAGALALKPECIAFDEATAMLDPVARRQVLDIMDRLNASGMTILHVTHDMDEAVRASRIILVQDGTVVLDCPREEFFKGEKQGVHGLLPRDAELARDLGLEPHPGEGQDLLCDRIVRAFGAAPAAAPAVSSAAAPAAVPCQAGTPAPGTPAPGPLPAHPLGDEPDTFVMDHASFSWMRGTMHQVDALMDASLRIPGGSLVAFVGATGSGKSTALQLLNGLSLPDSGTVLAFGTPTDARPPKEPWYRRTPPEVNPLPRLALRSPLAIQKPEAAIFEFHAADDVAFGPRNLGIRGKALKDRVSLWMAAFGLPLEEFGERPSRSLSGGEKRRLALAGIFAMESPALLLDEPGSALDPETRNAVMARIEDARRDGRTVVMVTHSMEEAARCDYVAVFHAGRLAAFDVPEKVFGADYQAAWGIDRPFVAEVAARLNLFGDDGTLPLASSALLERLGPGSPGCSGNPDSPGGPGTGGRENHNART